MIPKLTEETWFVEKWRNCFESNIQLNCDKSMLIDYITSTKYIYNEIVTLKPMF